MTYARNVSGLGSSLPVTSMNHRRTLDLVKSISLSEGESKRIDHEGCRAGYDGKKRLWVVRSSGRVGWKCHHCGEKGSAPVERNRTEVLKRLRPDEGTNPDKITLPYDFDSKFSNWPPEARAWVLKYGIEKPETWGWSESQGRVIIPVFRDGLDGYQLRRVLCEDPGPKYLTRGRNLVYKAGMGQGTCAVITEDALSAEKVGRITDAYAMLGTSRFSHADALSFAKKYDRIVVWFDDDGWQARKAQSQLATRLGLLMPTKIVRTGKDPKEHTMAEIKEIVC